MSKDTKPVFKVADIRDEDVTLLMEDGRAFTATIKEGVELKRRATVTITSDGVDEQGVPKDAQVVGVAS